MNAYAYCGRLKRGCIFSLLLIWSIGGGACAPSLLKNGTLDTLRIQKVLKETQNLRQLSFKTEVPLEIFSPQEMQEYFENEFRKEYPGERLNQLEKAYHRLGFLHKGQKLHELYSTFKASAVVGIYDDVLKKIFLLNAPPTHSFTIDLIQSLSSRDSVSEMVLSHEAVHALQDQHFNLNHITELTEKNQDFAWATSALIEGDADYASQGILNPLIIPDRRKKGYLEIPEPFLVDETLSQTPKILTLPFIFQYLYGAGFLKALTDSAPQKPYQKVNQAFKDLPQSTEQIIHPQKYLFQRDLPTPVSLDSLKPFFPSHTLLHEDTFGQLLFGIWVDARLDLATAYKVSQGWDGDRYLVFENPQTLQTLFLHLSIWDSQIDAIQYVKACKQSLEKKSVSFPSTEKDHDTYFSWNSPTEEGYLQRKQKAVFYAEGLSKNEIESIRFPVETLLEKLLESCK
jgi:hypothetical protein